MRKIALLVVGCLALTGCASDWEAEIRLEVTKIEEEPAQPTHPGRVRISTDLVGELPDGALERKYFTGDTLEPEEIDGDVKVGDEVICLAKQRTIGALQTNSIQTDLYQCRKA